MDFTSSFLLSLTEEKNDYTFRWKDAGCLSNPNFLILVEEDDSKTSL
jgi:hypothetical protein